MLLFFPLAVVSRAETRKRTPSSSTEKKHFTSLQPKYQSGGIALRRDSQQLATQLHWNCADSTKLWLNKKLLVWARLSWVACEDVAIHTIATAIINQICPLSQVNLSDVTADSSNQSTIASAIINQICPLSQVNLSGVTAGSFNHCTIAHAINQSAVTSVHHHKSATEQAGVPFHVMTYEFLGNSPIQLVYIPVINDVTCSENNPGSWHFQCGDLQITLSAQGSALTSEFQFQFSSEIFCSEISQTTYINVTEL